MTDYAGWQPTPQDMALTVRFMLEEEALTNEDVSALLELEVEGLYSSGFTLDGVASVDLPDFDYDLILIKSSQPVDIELTDVYNVSDSMFMFIRHTDTIDTGTNQISITGTVSNTDHDVQVLLIKEA